MQAPFLVLSLCVCASACVPACVSSASGGARSPNDAVVARSAVAPAPGETAPGETTVTASYDPCPPAGTPCKIMPLGDSITAGAGSTRNGSYRVELFRRALQARQRITFVGSDTGGPGKVDGVAFPAAHEGHSGYTIDDGGGRSGIAPLVAAAMASHRPNIVTLMIGTNDVDIRLDPANAPARLGALIDTIQAADPNVLVVLAKIVPTVSNAEDVAVVAYNEAMPALVASRVQSGKHIVLVDMHAAFKKNPNFASDYMTDNLHPNDAGYAVMGGVWYAALGPHLR